MQRRTVFAAGTTALLGVLVLAGPGCQSSNTSKQSDRSSSALFGLFSKKKALTLAEGTPIKVRTDVTLSTRTNKPGDDFTATLLEPVVAGSRVIARKGAEVRGVVAESDPGGRVKGRAHLAVRLTGLKTVNDDWANITSQTISRTAKSTRKRDAEEIGIGGAVGAAVGAIAGGGKGAAIGAAAGGGAGTGAVLATRGAPAVIPSESILNFTLSVPVKVTVAS